MFPRYTHNKSLRYYEYDYSYTTSVRKFLNDMTKIKVLKCISHKKSKLCCGHIVERVFIHEELMTIIR